jgi:peptidoglycan/LPS O-acetylase OafA/YrhL
MGALTGIQAHTALRPNRRLAELDGLRALAILPVIFNHCYPREGWWRWTSFLGEAGWMGVDLFFVLSGYLITGILLDTVNRKHYYQNFIIRRTLRIFPLYYLCLALFTIATRLADHLQWETMQTWGGVGWFFAYLGNIRLAWMNAMPPVFSFAPLWSLQVEEQFYLLYPLIVLFLSHLRLRQLLVTCVVVAPLLRSFLMFFVTGSGGARYVLTPCRMDSLALGGLVALLVRSPLAHILTLSQVRTGALVIGSVVSFCAIISTDWGSPIMSSVGYTAIGITSALLLIMVVLWPANMLAKWLRWRPLVYTGQIAYGLYLLHGPSSWVARSFIGWLTGTAIKGHSALSVPVTFVSAFIAAGLSWRFFESPILSLKDRLTR